MIQLATILDGPFAKLKLEMLKSVAIYIGEKLEMHF